MRPRSALWPLLALLGCSVGLITLQPTARARCTTLSLRADVARSPFVVEAAVESAGSVAQFRTQTVWKGGADVPARFTLRASNGVAPWPRVASVGSVYLVMLSGPGDQVRVRRCGRSGPITDALRAELVSLGLTPTPR